MQALLSARCEAAPNRAHGPSLVSANPRKRKAPLPRVQPCFRISGGEALQGDPEEPHTLTTGVFL